MSRRGRAASRIHATGRSLGGLGIAAVIAGCGGAPAASVGCTPGARSQVTGVVLSVTGTTPTEVSGFMLRTTGGDTLTFTVGTLELTEGAFPAGHLREHQATAGPVSVAFRTDCGRRVALRLTDG